MSMTGAVKSGSAPSRLVELSPSWGRGTQGTPVDLAYVSLLLVVAYIVSLVVVVAVLHRFYVHTFHFTPPHQRAYEELLAARRFAQQGAVDFDESARLFRPLRPILQASGSGSRREGVSGESRGGASQTHEAVAAMEEGSHFSSEVLSRLEQDLRATSLRDRERLAVALNAPGMAQVDRRTSILACQGSNASRFMALRLEVGVRLDGLHRASQSARFARATVSPLSPSPSPSSAAALRSNNGLMATHTRSISLQTLSELDWSSRSPAILATSPRRFVCGNIYINGPIRYTGNDRTYDPHTDDPYR